MPEPHSTRLPAAVRGDGRTALGRASDGRYFKGYDPARGREEPPAVIAARERHRAVSARIEAAREALEAGQARADVMPDPAPGYEWHRELADELPPAPDASPPGLAAAGPEPPAAPPPVTAASRCGRCGYLTTAAGHRVMCDE